MTSTDLTAREVRASHSELAVALNDKRRIEQGRTGVSYYHEARDREAYERRRDATIGSAMAGMVRLWLWPLWVIGRK